MIKDLTEGEPQSVLVQFTLPMFVSVVFQQMYNIADSAIAGKFAGEDALAAVGASYPITMIFMAIAVGSNVGCAVIISQLFGGRHYESMKTAISTTMISAFVLSIFLTIFGLAGNRVLMEMIHTPENIFADGALYLKIYIGGFLFLFLYNVATGIFTSLGDSKTPLYFLILCSFLKLLTERGRIREYEECVHQFELCYDDAYRHSFAKVYSAIPLTDDQKERLHAKLEQHCGHMVEMHYKIDPSLLGGLKVKMDGQMLDGSLRSRISSIKEVIEE